MMNEYIKSIMSRDPAAKSSLSIILTYPGVKAIFFHRIANFFSKAGFALIARIVSQFLLQGVFLFQLKIMKIEKRFLQLK